MAVNLLRIVTMALVVFGFAAMPSRPAQAAPKSSAEAPAIVMYTTQSCGYCAKARKYLQARGLRWDERDIETSAQAQLEWKTLGGAGTPLILVGDQKISGFHQARLDAVLAKHAK